MVVRICLYAVKLQQFAGINFGKLVRGLLALSLPGLSGGEGYVHLVFFEVCVRVLLMHLDV